MTALDGRVAIVTGGGEGVGRGIALRLACAGATVVVANRKTTTGDAVVAEIEQRWGRKAAFIRTDVTDREAVTDLVRQTHERFGSVDILVNNAYGGGATDRLERLEDEDFDAATRINVMAAWWAMRQAFPYMKAQQWGRIINITSLNGVNAHLYTAPYNVAKEGLRTLTRTAAREWARFGICANAICPAAISTAFQQYAEASPDNAAAVAGANPMGRIGDPETDIGGVAVFLAGEDARYTTGNTIFVDGGAHINGVAWEPAVPE